MTKNMTKRKQTLWTRWKKQASLQIILIAGLVFLLIFCYAPMCGLILAFKDYKLSSGLAGIFTSEWVGLKWFKEFLDSPMFSIVVRNTLVLSLLKLCLAFPASILFALLLNEVRAVKFKKLVQTASYLPHFMSWVIVSGLCFTMFSSNNGLINNILLDLGIIDKGMTLLYNEKQYWGLAVGTQIWKETGWGAIIYIAAISGIDTTMYEAADIDGASRLQKIRYITLPSIKGTIIVMFILALGGLVSGNLDQTLVLGNGLNRDYSEIINSYVLTIGLRKYRFDYASAVGLMQSLISVILVFASNKFSKKNFGAALY